MDKGKIKINKTSKKSEEGDLDLSEQDINLLYEEGDAQKAIAIVDAFNSTEEAGTSSGLVDVNIGDRVESFKTDPLKKLATHSAGVQEILEKSGIFHPLKGEYKEDEKVSLTETLEEILPPPEDESFSDSEPVDYQTYSNIEESLGFHKFGFIPLDKVPKGVDKFVKDPSLTASPIIISDKADDTSRFGPNQTSEEFFNTLSKRPLPKIPLPEGNLEKSVFADIFGSILSGQKTTLSGVKVDDEIQFNLPPPVEESFNPIKQSTNANVAGGISSLDSLPPLKPEDTPVGSVPKLEKSEVIEKMLHDKSSKKDKGKGNKKHKISLQQVGSALSRVASRKSIKPPKISIEEGFLFNRNSDDTPPEDEVGYLIPQPILPQGGSGHKDVAPDDSIASAWVVKSPPEPKSINGKERKQIDQGKEAEWNFHDSLKKSLPSITKEVIKHVQAYYEPRFNQLLSMTEDMRSYIQHLEMRIEALEGESRMEEETRSIIRSLAKNHQDDALNPRENKSLIKKQKDKTLQDDYLNDLTGAGKTSKLVTEKNKKETKQLTRSKDLSNGDSSEEDIRLKSSTISSLTQSQDMGIKGLKPSKHQKRIGIKKQEIDALPDPVINKEKVESSVDDPDVSTIKGLKPRKSTRLTDHNLVEKNEYNPTVPTAILVPGLNSDESDHSPTNEVISLMKDAMSRALKLSKTEALGHISSIMHICWNLGYPNEKDLFEYCDYRDENYCDLEKITLDSMMIEFAQRDTFKLCQPIFIERIKAKIHSIEGLYEE